MTQRILWSIILIFTFYNLHAQNVIANYTYSSNLEKLIRDIYKSRVFVLKSSKEDPVESLLNKIMLKCQNMESTKFELYKDTSITLGEKIINVDEYDLANKFSNYIHPPNYIMQGRLTEKGFIISIYKLENKSIEPLIFYEYKRSLFSTPEDDLIHLFSDYYKTEYIPSGTIRFSVDPPDCKIKITESRYDKNDLVIISNYTDINLKIGKYRFAISKQGYIPLDTLVEINQGDIVKLNFSLIRTIKLGIKAYPKNSQVAVEPTNGILNISEHGDTLWFEMMQGDYAVTATYGERQEAKFFKLKYNNLYFEKFDLTKKDIFNQLLSYLVPGYYQCRAGKWWGYPMATIVTLGWVSYGLNYFFNYKPNYSNYNDNYNALYNANKQINKNLINSYKDKVNKSNNIATYLLCTLAAVHIINVVEYLFSDSINQDAVEEEENTSGFKISFHKDKEYYPEIKLQFRLNL